MVHNSHMDGVASAFDLVMAATVAILTVAGVYWALVRRVDKADSAISAESSARQSDLKAIGSDIVRIDQRLGKVEETAEKLRRRSDYQRGREAAERSGVEDMPRRRTHDPTDTFPR